MTHPSRPTSPRRHGLTLVELVVALALTTIVVGAATSVMFVASRALPGPADPVVRATDAASALALFESEAQSAIAVGVSGTTIKLRIPDRNGDTIPEDISYAWAGDAGDALVRQDSLATYELITDVQNAVVEGVRARGSGTRVGVLNVTLTLRRGLVVRSSVRLPAEPENSL